MTNSLVVNFVAWAIRKISDITTKVGSGSTPRGGESVYRNSGVPLIRSMNVYSSGFRPDGLAFIDAAEAKKLDHVIVQPNDVLLNITGASIGRVTIAPKSMAGARVNQHVCIIRPTDEVVPSFLAYYLASPKQQARVMNVQVGATRQALTKAMILNWDVPVPAIDEQHRIVAEIEKQFSCLDEAVASLKRVKAKLKRYRAAVLKAAVEGKLTEGWRKQHPDVEPASKLLERILAERRAKWTGKGKYKEPTEPDMNNFPSLPGGWIWAAANQLCDFITKGTTPIASKLREATGDVSFLKVYNLTFTGRLDLTIKPTFIDRAVHDGELGRSKVKIGDVLINIVGPPLGQVAIVPDSLAEANINQAIARFRVLEPMSNHYVATGLMSEPIMGWAIKRAKTTAGQSNLTLELCRALPFPLPPREEQKAIVLEVERRLSVIDELEAAIDANLTRADRLRQSVLHCAFCGRLFDRDILRPVALPVDDMPGEESNGI